ILEHAQAIGRQGGTGGGDVDQEIGNARGGGSFGGAEAFHRAVFGNPGLGEMLAGDGDILGGDAQPAAVAGAEVGGDIGQIVREGDVDPGIGHGDDDIGSAETGLAGNGDAGRAGFAGLVDQIEAGNAQIDGAANEFAGDLEI